MEIRRITGNMYRVINPKYDPHTLKFTIQITEDDLYQGDGSGQVYVFNPSSGSLINTLSNPNAFGNMDADGFGISVAISGDYAIIGVRFEDDAGGTSSGKAYIFNATTGALLHTLDNPNAYSTSASDNFGAGVGISDSYAIVGPYSEDDAGGTSSGKAYIFSVATGALLHTLDNPNAYSTSLNDYFGLYVAISDSYTIVSAKEEDDSGGLKSGKVYIFNTTTGALLHTLDNPNAYDTSAYDEFGISVDISGNYVIVGAQGEDEVGGTSSGKAYIFNATTGALLHTLDNPNAYNTVASDYFGYTVAIHGSYAIVGSKGEDDAGGTSSGKVYIFNATTGALLHTLDNPNAYNTSGGDYFGYSIDISDSYVIVGAYAEDDAGGTSSGKAYIFNVATGALLHTLDNPNAYFTSASDYFGYSVAISDTACIAGAYKEEDSSLGGYEYILDGSFNSPEGADSDSALIDWGDGSPYETQLDYMLNHLYAEVGTYEITVKNQYNATFSDYSCWQPDFGGSLNLLSVDTPHPVAYMRPNIDGFAEALDAAHSQCHPDTSDMREHKYCEFTVLGVPYKILFACYDEADIVVTADTIATLGECYYITDYNSDSWETGVPIYQQLPETIIVADAGDGVTNAVVVEIPYITTWSAFEGCLNLIEVHDDYYMYVNRYVSLMHYEMFKNCTSLIRIPTNIFNRNPLKIRKLEGNQFTWDFQYTFEGCTSLTTIPANLLYSVGGDHWSTIDHDYSTYAMFFGCTALTTIEGPIFNPNTEFGLSSYSTALMFYGCTSLLAVPDGFFAGHCLLDFQEEFYGCTSLTALPSSMFSGFKDDPVTGRGPTFGYSMFSGCTGITEYNIQFLKGAYTDNNLTTCPFLSGLCESITSIPAGVFSSIPGSSQITDLAYAFDSWFGVTTIAAGILDTLVNLTTARSLFAGLSITSIPAGLLMYNTALTNVSGIFFGCSNLAAFPNGIFSTLPLLNDLGDAFEGCSSMNNSCDTLWLTYPAADALDCFKYCTALTNYGDIPANWL